MGFANAVVSRLLRSPIHRLLSGSTALIRYTGRRSGRVISTPTQYVRRDSEVIIAVGRPEAKTWWRNFTVEGDIDVLVRRQWLSMTARAVVRADEPETIAPLLTAYLQRFPKAGRALGADTRGSDSRQVVLVWCRPR